MEAEVVDIMARGNEKKIATTAVMKVPDELESTPKEVKSVSTGTKKNKTEKIMTSKPPVAVFTR